MLIGEYSHVLDQKNRVIVPQKFREIDGKEGAVWSQFILTRGPEDSILVYTPEAWRRLQEVMFGRGALPDANRRKFQRLLYAGGAECHCDRQGRIVVPEKLRLHAGLKRDVTWIGAGDRAELWATERWRAYEEQNLPLFQETFDRMADEVGGIPPSPTQGSGSP